MGRETSKLISDISSNAFEVKFNQIDIDKASEKNMNYTTSYLKMKRNAYIDVMYHDLLDNVENFFEIKKISNQDKIHKIVSSESFQNVINNIATIKNSKDHALRERAIDNIINQYPTIFDRYF